jgi:ketosteroid isomerase-like protein
MNVPSDPSIDRLYAAWRDAITRKDVEAIVGLLAPDYVLWAPNAAPMDIAQLRPRLRAALAIYDIEPSFEREEQIVSGSIAFERGYDVQVARPLAGGPVQVQRQRVFLLLVKGDDGEWRFARGMSQPGPTTG